MSRGVVNFDDQVSNLENLRLQEKKVIAEQLENFETPPVSFEPIITEVVESERHVEVKT